MFSVGVDFLGRNRDRWASEKYYKSFIRHSLEPVLTINQLLGVAPGLLDCFRSQYSACRVSLFKYCPVIQLLCTVLVLAIEATSYSYTFIFRMHFVKIPFFNNLLYNLEILSGMVNSLVILVDCQLGYRKFNDILQRIVALFVDIQHHQREQDLLCVAGKWKKLFYVSVVFYPLVILSEFFANEDVYMTLSSVGCYHVPNIIVMQSIFQYWFVVSYARDRYRRLNDLLHLAGGCQYVRSLTSRVETIEELRVQQKALNDFVQFVNECYGRLIVMSIASVIVTLSIELLEVYRVSLVRPFGLTEFLQIFYTIVWVCWIGFALFLILYPNYAMESERNQTYSVIFEFPRSEAVELNNLLMHFSQQLLHQKGSYTACGIVEINMKLVATILSALTTYLVILLQFDVAVH